nr:hypothetical protein [Tanacetum cinerariifolium]
IIMENIPPPNNNPNVLEEEPILDQTSAALVGFAPQWIGGQIPDKNNGWLEEDPEEEPEEEEIEDEDMVNDEEDNAKVDPHNRPPPTSDEETELAPPVVQIADADDVPIPHEEPSIYTALVLRADDPYVMVRDAAMDTLGDEDVDTDAPWDTQPFEPRGSPRDSQQSMIICSFFILLPLNRNHASKKKIPNQPQPTLTQEAVDQPVRDGIEAAIRA